MAEKTSRRADGREPSPEYRELPPTIAVEDMVTTHEATPPSDPLAGRDPETDFVLRHAFP